MGTMISFSRKLISGGIFDPPTMLVANLGEVQVVDF
jgi:hypothetical protein